MDEMCQSLEGVRRGEVGERQGEVGERQGEAGERQGEVGESQGEVGGLAEVRQCGRERVHSTKLPAPCRLLTGVVSHGPKESHGIPQVTGPSI